MSAINEYEYQQIHDKRLAESICVAATVKVVAFDPAKMTVDVQPLSKHLQNGKYESQPPILGVPVACTRCGGFITRPWIKAGDTGVVVYLDHDMDSTVTGGKEAKPRRTLFSSAQSWLAATRPPVFRQTALSSPLKTAASTWRYLRQGLR